MSRLLDLPNEVLLIVAYFLSRGDAINWSSSASSLRAALAPIVYASIAFDDNPLTASSILKVVQKHSEWVKTLIFTSMVSAAKGQAAYHAARQQPDSSTEGNTKHNSNDENNLLPEAVQTLLEGKYTPQASRMILRIQIEARSKHAESLFTSPGDLNRPVLQTIDPRWRPRTFMLLLMASIWRTVATNKQITHLEVPQMLPAFVYSWQETSFKRFLGRLDTLSISIRTVNIEKDWIIPYCYQHLADQLASFFFSETKQLRKLSLTSALGRPMGTCDWDIDYDSFSDWMVISLPFTKADMPNLRSLELSQCFVCPELVRFLSRHKETLRVLRLDCLFASRFASGTDFSQQGLCSALVESGMRLTETSLRTCEFMPFSEHFSRGERLSA